jgi:hypothetical protein
MWPFQWVNDSLQQLAEDAQSAGKFVANTCNSEVFGSVASDGPKTPGKAPEVTVKDEEAARTFADRWHSEGQHFYNSRARKVVQAPNQVPKPTGEDRKVTTENKEEAGWLFGAGFAEFFWSPWAASGCSKDSVEDAKVSIEVSLTSVEISQAPPVEADKVTGKRKEEAQWFWESPFTPRPPVRTLSKFPFASLRQKVR